jgi:NADH dehydrogenase [ubiquinone] 1 alpha subcomplex assembly factor 1
MNKFCLTLCFGLINSMAVADINTSMITAFDRDTSDLRWRTVNDNVMGGRSRGDYQINDGVLSFRGSTNTNGGGFSSIRTSRVSLDLSDASGFSMRLRGDGRVYTFRVTTSRGRVSYWAEFPTRAHGKWVEVRIPFETFWPNIMGRRLRGPALDPSAISGLGLMIYDKQDGPFDLEVDWIRSYSEEDVVEIEDERRVGMLEGFPDGD